jgi:hypothetical protein
MPSFSQEGARAPGCPDRSTASAIAESASSAPTVSRSDTARDTGVVSGFTSIVGTPAFAARRTGIAMYGNRLEVPTETTTSNPRAISRSMSSTFSRGSISPKSTTSGRSTAKQCGQCGQGSSSA